MRAGGNSAFVSGASGTDSTPVSANDATQRGAADASAAPAKAPMRGRSAFT
jgi:hypothetical protein